MDKVIYYNSLYSIYGELLTDKEKELFCLYYEENLTMEEIANLKKISKSAVGKRIKDAMQKLQLYESKIKMLSKTNQIINIVNEEEKEKIIKIIAEEE